MKKEKNLAPRIAIVMVLMLATAAALLATPVLAAPPEDKYVADLYYVADPCGQVIFNTNLEDEGCYELEVEVEECMAFAEGNAWVGFPGGLVVGPIYVDEYGNGEETFCVDAISTEGWRLWVQGSGPK